MQSRFCQRCGALELNKISDQYNKATTHHINFKRLQTAASEGCPCCQIFERALIDATLAIHTDWTRDEAIEHHLWRDQHDNPILLWAFTYPLDAWECGKEEGVLGFFYQRPAVKLSGNETIDGVTGSIEARLQLASANGKHDRVVGRLLSRDINFDLCRSWLQTCSKRHDRCEYIDDEKLPTRVLDVGLPDNNAVRLLDTREKYGQYVTLSHCWGTSRPLMTTTDTLKQHLEKIELDAMPNTFRDAVLATRKLGFQYLWIDSLCIIQGDRGDWDIECAKMEGIYQRSAVTIAGPAAGGADAGFLHERSSHSGAQCPFPSGSSSNDLVLSYPTLDFLETEWPQELNSPLRSRGWVVQERLLSPRVLYFGTSQLYFECNTTDFYECCWLPLTVERASAPAKTQAMLPDKKHRNIDNIRRAWYKIVDSYTRCQLSVASDKLPALAGIATAFAKRMGDWYLAGLFRDNFAHELIWQPRKHDSISKPYQSYIAPSWSWASHNGPVYFLAPALYRSVLELKEHDVMPTSQNNPFGEVIAGSVVVRGKIRSAKVTRMEPPKRSDRRRHDSTLIIQDPMSLNQAIAAYEPVRDEYSDQLGHSMTILCLLVLEKQDLSKGHGQPYGPAWYAIVVERVPEDPDTYRRLGIIHSENCVTLNDGKEKCGLSYDEHMAFWDGSELKNITLI